MYQKFRQNEPPVQSEIDLSSMECWEHVSLDYGEINGRYFLVAVDRLSGWTLHQQSKSQSFEDTAKHLKSWFSVLGLPKIIRTDGGPCFREVFTKFCKERGITHKMSSAMHPSSNGIAENGIGREKE